MAAWQAGTKKAGRDNSLRPFAYLTVGLKDIPAQVFVFCQLAQFLVYIGRGDFEHLGYLVAGIVREAFQQALQYRMQAAGADVFGGFVHLVGHFRNAGNRIVCERQFHAFGAHQGFILLHQRGVRLGQDALEVVRGQRLQLYPDRQTALQFRNQVRRLGQVERARGDEQNVIGTHGTILGAYGAALDQRQQVTLYAFAGDVRRGVLGTLGHLVDLVEKHNAVLLNSQQRFLLDLFLVHQLGGFLVLGQFQGICHLHLPSLALVGRQVREHALQLVSHLLHAGRRHNLNAGAAAAQVNLDFLVVQLTFPQFLAEHLASGGIVAGTLAVFVEIPRRRQQNIQNAVFGRVQGTVFVPFHLLLTEHLHSHIRQVPDNGLHIPAHVAHFGKLGGFYLQEGRVGQLRQAAGNLGFTHAGGADHQDILGGNLVTQAAVQLHPAPAVTQGNGHGTLGFLLAHDVFVKFVNDFTGSHCRHGRSGQSLMGSTSRVRFWLV